MTISRAMVFALLLAATACAPGLRQLSTPAERAVIPHAIFVDNEGRGVRADSTASGKTMSDAEYRAHVSEMMAGLRRSGVKRVLVRVHGGLNTLNGALDATSKMRERIMADTAAAGYPIFINWESGIKSSYLEHLTMISQGQRYPTFAREVIATPFYFLADAGRAVKRAPIVWAGQLARYWHSQPLTASQPDPVASLVATGDIDRWEGTYSRGAGEVTRFVASSTVLSPVKMFSAVVVDAGGTPGWDNMRRRTKTMFRQPSEFIGVREAAAATRTEVAADMNVKRAGSAEEHRLAATYASGTGAVAILFDSLKAFEDSTPGAEITLIGHSMGAIIVNEIIRTQPKMDFKNIVFTELK